MNVCDSVGDVAGDNTETQRSSSSRYSRVSVDEMDIERMFERTSSMDDQESCSTADVLVEDPLSPTDYTLQVDDEEEELNRLDTLP